MCGLRQEDIYDGTVVQQKHGQLFDPAEIQEVLHRRKERRRGGVRKRMTREEAIKGLEGLARNFGGYKPNEEMFDMAIAALKAESCDAVSRADTLQSFESYCENNCQYSKKQRDVMCGACMMGDAIEIVENLPPVTPKQRTGKWIAQDIHNCHTDFKCSECGYIHSFMHLYGKSTADYTYCPSCGAKMEGESE